MRSTSELNASLSAVAFSGPLIFSILLEPIPAGIAL
jgi:hypothetical protein